MNKILFVSHSGYTGGAQYVLDYLVEYTCSNQIFDKVHLVYPKTHGDDLKNRYDKQDIVIRSFYYFVSPPSIFYQILIFLMNIPSFFQLGYYIIKNNISVVYINSSVNLMPLTLAFILKRKTFFHIHENSNDLVRVTPTYTRFVYRCLLSKKNVHTIFVSQTSMILWERDLKIKFDISNASIIYSPVKNISHTNIANEILQKEFIYGYLGSITREKNIENILHAFKIFLSTQNITKPFKFVICGDGPYTEKLKDMVEKMGLVGFVNFEPSVKDSSVFYSKIDVLIQSSLNESWGLVAIEAMICKKPVIMTNQSGLTELFTDNIDCLFFNPIDANELANKISLISNTDLLNKLVDNAYSKVIQYDFTETFNKSMNMLLTSSKSK